MIENWNIPWKKNIVNTCILLILRKLKKKQRMENSLIKEICLFLHFYCLKKPHNIFNWKSLKSGKKFEGEYASREMYVPLSFLRRCRSIKLVSQLNVFKHLNHQYSCLSVCLLNVHATFCIIRTKYDFRKQGI